MEPDVTLEGVWRKEKFSEGKVLLKKLIIELTEYLLKRDYLKLEETELILIINVNLLSSSVFPSILSVGMGTQWELVFFFLQS